jgi:hypothetical protein
VHWLFAARSIEPSIYKLVRNKEDFTTAHYKRHKHQQQNGMVSFD